MTDAPLPFRNRQDETHAPAEEPVLAETGFPRTRMRRTRRHAWTRKLVAENTLTTGDLIWPVFIHEGDNTARTWRTDIGITRVDQDTYRFAITVGHFMREGYLGREPKRPLPTAPRLVGWLLRSRDWQAFSGTEELLCQPRVLNTGDGEAFRRRLEDPGRECPIVLVSRDFASGDFLIDPDLLARKLAGSAAVYETASSELDKELEWCLGRRFSCWNGMVRVYQPGLHFDPADARKHRFIAGRDIRDLGGDSVVEMLVRGVARRAEAAPTGVVAAIEDMSVSSGWLHSKPLPNTRTKPSGYGYSKRTTANSTTRIARRTSKSSHLSWRLPTSTTPSPGSSTRNAR